MSVDLLFKQANAAYLAGDYAAAERRYKALTRLKPLWAYHNLGALYVATRRFSEAEAAFRQALATDPSLPDSRNSLGMLLLGGGRYAEGWPLTEARREIPSLNIGRPTVGCPEWAGEDLTGKRLLVYPEQGFGDQIQCFRFALELVRRGAFVTYICRPSLVTLFEGRGVDLVAATPGCRIPDGDFWTFCLSLPLHMGVTVETIPSAPYLPVAGDHVGGVGVMTSGSPTHKNDRNRSLGRKAGAQLSTLGRSLAPEDTGAADFLETARIVAGLDLVITVDTALAHLAGAMGKPVWILLSGIETDWRWLRDRTDSPWYPSARLYRQSSLGDWGSVLRQVTADLADFRPAGR